MLPYHLHESYKKLATFDSLQEAHKSFNPKQVRTMVKKIGCNMQKPHTWLETVKALPFEEWEQEYSFL